ncbi:hypothetical protein FRC08_004989 [Ceratobasidium sp. 394]|nr:hypothetical protein FRC08_004989 [Ceratobasidium sp. 394]KAG9084138.1 hypothetical protein FS749_005453 [Ceratobasidium sp. UAMH 11750]
MSNDQSLFLAAAVPFFRTTPEADLMRQLDTAFHMNGRYSERAIEFRTDSVRDFRGFHVPAAAERLIRWDRRHPDVVFTEGFLPHVAPADHGSITPGYAWDLGAYVDSNVDSVFVGTARYYRNAETNRPTRWVPRNHANMFEYEVFANGGIDVNLSLGTGNRFFNQHEIAFPGGIRPEFIRTARQYDGTGRVVAIWANPNFDIRASGEAHGADLTMLPDPVCGVSIDVHYWTGPRDHRLPRRQLIVALGGDPLREDGAPADDEAMGDSCSTISIPHLTRAAFLNPANRNEAYIFADTQYALITVAPGTHKDNIILGPNLIIQQWPSLKAAHFGKVDAVLPTGNGNEAYFFAQDEYALIDVAPGTNKDKLVNGPHKIADAWPALKQAGCKTVDAVLPYPGVGTQAYFFCGSKYTVIHFTPGTTDDYIVQAPKDVSAGWTSLASMNFNEIDMVLPNPNDENEAYFFERGRYALIKVNPGDVDTVVLGPKWADHEWPALTAAKFYGHEPDFY